MRDNRHRASGEQVAAELARLLPVPGERDLPEGRQAILKEHLMTELRQADRRQAHRRWGAGRRRWAVLTATAAAAVVVGAVGTLTAVSGHRSPPASPGHHQTRQITAAQLLAKIATEAARQPSQNVRDDQYMYIASEDRYTSSSATVSKNGKLIQEPTRVGPLHKRQIWLSVSDLCKPGLLRDPSVAPGPIPLNDGGGGPCPNRGGWGDPTYRFLQSLPADPRTLLTRIYAATRGHGQSPDQEAFTAIGDMLREAVAPPGTSAALYRAAALIPGVRVVPHVMDIAGQPGVGIQLASGPVWIFDAHTLQWLGENDGSVHGNATGSVVLKRSIVDRPGQVPSQH